MAEYLLHDGIDDDYNNGVNHHHQQDLRYATGGASHLSSLMLATDDLEIPLISDGNNFHQNGGGATGIGGSGGNASEQHCLFGQVGFRPGHSEYTSNKQAKQQLIVATVICFLFMIAELIGGLMAGSLAVVTDAAHLLTDCIGFIVAMVAISFSKRMPDQRMTFGYKRFEVLGAVISVLGIWLLTGILVYLAVLRVIDQSFEIDANTMIIISSVGVAINIVMASVLHGNCLSVPLAHGHSHGPGGHGHSHSSSRPCKQPSAGAGQLATLSTTTTRKDDAVLAHGVINMHSTSIHTTHSRHNSFSKTLPNGGNLLDSSELNGGLMASGGGSAALLIAANGNNNGGADKSSYARINLDQQHNGGGNSPGHKHHRRHGSYTLLSMSNNEDGLIVGDNRQIACDSDEEVSGDEHHHHNCDDEVDELQLGDGGKKGGSSSSSNLNIRAAMIHVIGDFVQSIGVLISAVVIKIYPQAKLIDPACTFVFSVIVFFTTIRIMKESLTVLLDATPLTINLDRLRRELLAVEGVRALHHLNVFGISVDWNVMSVHLVIDNMTSGDEVVRTVSKLVKRAYNIRHVTVQIERQKMKLPMSSPIHSHNNHHHNHHLQIGNELI